METIHAVYRGEIKSIYIHQYFYCMIIKIKIHNNKDTYTRTYHMYLQFINNQRVKTQNKKLERHAFGYMFYYKQTIIFLKVVTLTFR